MTYKIVDYALELMSFVDAAFGVTADVDANYRGPKRGSCLHVILYEFFSFFIFVFL